jgi:hypothetical protein
MLFFVLAGVLTLAGCNKQKMCRCAVLHEQTVRLVELEKGDCRDIRFIYYDEDALNPNVTDSVLCTDYDFAE